MVVFPNAKINIGLRILHRRSDGFHNISTFFYPIPYKDILEIIPSHKLSFHTSGLPIQGNKEDNLCLKAYHLLKADYPKIPSFAIHLHKNIPMGAGLGGGSADAAFILKAINKKSGLELSNKQLTHYAAQLGSDCSFFIENSPALASGKGEVLQSISINNLSGYQLLIVTPNNISINTARAYQNIQPQEEEIPLSNLIQRPISSWKDNIKNDFEAAIFKQHPLLQKIKTTLYNKGAIYAALSGSGSSIYGIFPNEIDFRKLHLDASTLKSFSL